MSANNDNIRSKFDNLRAKYLAAKTKRDEHEVELSVTYGNVYNTSWLKAGERKRREQLTTALGRVGDALFAHIQSFSPRDWSYGVPSYWVREKLTFEDAARPADEPLSVIPPLSYGSTVART